MSHRISSSDGNDVGDIDIENNNDNANDSDNITDNNHRIMIATTIMIMITIITQNRILTVLECDAFNRVCVCDSLIML